MTDGVPVEKKPSASESGAPFMHLEEANQTRLSKILCDFVPEVFKLNRIIEQRTGYTSEIGRNMLVDVLSHLGTLASRRDLTSSEEATQLSKIEEHLRRAIIEHPEEVVRDRLGEVRTLWSEYQREAYTYREEDAIRGAPRHSDLEGLRKRIDVLMESARKAKPDETNWEESLNAAADMTEAAHLAGDLADKLEQCIGAARILSEQRGRDLLATRRDRNAKFLRLVALVVAIAVAAGSYLLGKSGDSNSTGQKQGTTTSFAPKASTP